MLPALPASTEASCMCSFSTSSSLKAALSGGNSFLFPLQLPLMLVPSIFSTPAGSSHPQLHCQESSEHPDGDRQELYRTHSSPRFWLCNGHSIHADPEDDAKLHQLFKNGSPLGSAKIVASKMDFVATNGRLRLYRLQFLAGFAKVTALPKPLCLGALPGGQETFLPSPNTFQLGHWEKWPELSFFQGKWCLQPMLSPIPTQAYGHCITCHFSHHPLLRQGSGPWLTGTCSEATSASLALVSSMQG